MPTKYDAEILQAYADALYRRARTVAIWIPLKYAAWGLVLGLIGTWVLWIFTPETLDTRVFRAILVALCILLPGVAGVDIARRRAFELTLKAQRILCEIQIERNTRSTAHTAGS